MCQITLFISLDLYTNPEDLRFLLTEMISISEMKSPLLFFGLGLLLVLSPVAALTCDITATGSYQGWTKSSYHANETMVFRGTISPSPGFIDGYIVNLAHPGDHIYEFSHTPTNGNSFEVDMPTNDLFLNGTYRATITYKELNNLTDCPSGTSVAGSTELETDNTQGTIVLNINLGQTYSQTPISATGSPIETPLGTITSSITGTAATGFAPSIRINGTQLVQGTGIGTLDLQLSQCQQNEAAQKAYQDVAAFLSSDYTNVLNYQQENARLTEQNSELTKKIEDPGGLNDQVTNLTANVAVWKMTANNKWDAWLVLGLGIPLGIFIWIMVQFYVHKRELMDRQPPMPIQETGMILHR